MDVFTQADEIKRRRALLDAMLQQSQQAPIVGNTGLGQALAKLGTAYITSKGQERLADSSAQNRTDYQTQLAAELEGFNRKREGAPGGSLSDGQMRELMLNDKDPGMMAAPTPGDPKAAVFAAIASKFPEMQAIGQAGLKDVLSQQKGRNAQNIKEVNGQLIDVTTGQVVGDYRNKQDKYSEPYMMDGPNGQKVLVRKNEATGKVEAVVGAGQNINVNTGDNAAIKDLIQNTLPGGKGHTAATGAGQAIQLAAEQVAAINQGAQSGSLGAIQQELRKFGELVGVPNAVTAPTEMLGNLAKQRVIAKLGGLGNQISNSDRDFLSSAQGDLSTNPEALKRMLAISIAADMISVQRHNKVAGTLASKIDPELAGTGQIPLNFQITDPGVANMVERILQGKPSVDGKPGATSANPTGGSPTPGKPTVTNW